MCKGFDFYEQCMDNADNKQSDVFDINNLKYLDAEDFCNQIIQIGSHALTEQQIHDVCLAILEADEDVAYSIYRAKLHHFWDDSVKEFHLAILEARGDVIGTIALAAHNCMWDNSIYDATLAILERCHPAYIIKYTNYHWWSNKTYEKYITKNRFSYSYVVVKWFIKDMLLCINKLLQNKLRMR